MRGIEYFNPRPLGGPAKFIILRLYTTLYVMKTPNLGLANSSVKVKISDPTSFKILSKHDRNTTTQQHRKNEKKATTSNSKTIKNIVIWCHTKELSISAQKSSCLHGTRSGA